MLHTNENTINSYLLLFDTLKNNAFLSFKTIFAKKNKIAPMRNILLALVLFLGLSNSVFSQDFGFLIETTTANESFTIPVDGSLTYNYNADIINPFVPSATVSYTNQTGALTHTFGQAGIYLIRILDGSVFPRIDFSNSADKLKITFITSWGNNPWVTMESAFEGCSNLKLSANDTPNLSNLTSTQKMFFGATALEDTRDTIGSWDMSTVERMGFMFRDCTIFNEDISNWDTSSAETFTRMFQNAPTFDQNLGNWDLSSLTSNGTDAMFVSAGVSTSNYDQTIIGWGTLDPGETSVPNDLNIRFDNSTYCTSASIRTTLSNAPFNWTFTDNGLDCSTISDDVFFITTWDTTTANESITIPGQGTNYYIDWGDGTIESSVSGNVTHSYTTPGTHTIKIGGDFKNIAFSGGGDRLKIKSIDQWGAIRWTTMFEAFEGCSNLKYTATDVPDLRLVTRFDRMFSGCSDFDAQNLNNWDTSSVTSATFMFNGASDFNGDVSGWDVSNFIDFRSMFSGAISFNQNISGWLINTSEPVDMAGMFSGASAFNQPIGSWNVSRVTDIQYMFERAVTFNQSLDTWNVTNVTTMEGMFYEAFDFNQSLGSWDISNVSDMTDMLRSTELSIENYDATISGWATLETGETQIPSNINLGANGLEYCTARTLWNTLDTTYSWTITGDGVNCDDSAFITTWETTTNDESITIPTFANGFNYYISWGDGAEDFGQTGDATHTYATPGTYTVKIAGSFPHLYFNDTGDKLKIKSIEQWGAIGWGSLSSAFEGCSALVYNATDAPNLNNVGRMDMAFANCTSFNPADLNNWDVSGIAYMQSMFSGATLFNAAIDTWEVSQVRDLKYMFSGATSFNQDISGWTINTQPGMTLEGVFSGATSFNQPIGSWTVNTVNSTKNMFLGAESFNQSLAAWDISKVVNMTDMLSNSGMSIENYDSTLIGWATLDTGELQIPTNINLGVDGIQYCEAIVERFELKSNYNWTFTDTMGCPEEDKLIMVWKTTSDNEGIKIQTTGPSYYTIDWGDGTSVEENTSTHTYATAGTYLVKLSGEFRIRYNNLPATSSTRLKLYEIKQWGANPWVSTAQAFYGCDNLKITATDVPDLSQATDMTDMFRNCFNLEDIGGQMGTWDVSTIENFNTMFQSTTSFSRSLGDWDLSSATSMGSMLNGSGLTSNAYDLTLIGWRNNPNTPSNISLGASNLTYCNATSEHDYLDNDLNWNLNDAGINCPAEEAFITKWQTTTANESITIPTDGSGYNYYVDWGDGTAMTLETGDATHEYATAGIYDVKITGEFPQIYFENSTSDNSNKILSIEQWGAIEWNSMARAFRGCSNLVINATDVPDLSSVTNMNFMFTATSSFVDNGGRIGDWNVSNIEIMGYVFQSSAFNENINNWDVSNVKFLAFMFRNNASFNQPLNNWQLSNDVNLAQMLINATSFNQDLGDWDISGVNSMYAMLSNTGMSVENYDNTLIGWATLDANETQIPSDILLGADGLKYCASQTERDLLGATYNWTITDAGIDCGNIAFITNWQTTNANETITIPTTGSGYNYTVDWGDGTIEDGFTGDATHSYTTAGTYSVKIWGSFPRIYFNAIGDKDKILSIEQWGPNQWTHMGNAFRGCSNLVLNADDTPDFSGVTNMNIDKMFSSAINLIDHKNQIGNWNVSNVNRMFGTFNNCKEFNEDISGWNVSNVTTFLQAFLDAEKFNQDLSQWNTSSATTMATMFARAYKFNQDISGWNTSNVNNMGSMFTDATDFNQDISGWDVSSVENMQSMFARATSFNQDLSGWDISSLGTGTSGNSALNMFLDATAFSSENYDALLIGWAADSSGTPGDDDDDIPTNITFTSNTTTYCDGLAARNILTNNSWTITDAGLDCDEIAFITTWQTTNANESITIPTFSDSGEVYNYAVDWGDGTIEINQTGNATHSYVTANTYTVKIIGQFPRIRFNDEGDKDKILTIEQWGPNQWTTMSKAFMGCSNLVLNADDSPDFSRGGASAIGLQQMFSGATNLVDLKDQIVNWNVSNVNNMYATFFGCEEFNENIGGWNVSNVTNFIQTFLQARKFNQDLSSWVTSNATTMSAMFASANDFNQNISGWNTSNVNNMTSMFSFATAFNQDISSWDVSSVESFQGMFNNAENFNQDLSDWDISSLGTGTSTATIGKSALNMFLDATAFSPENYDALLIGWATDSSGTPGDDDDDIPTTITFTTSTTYCIGLVARGVLTNTPNNWNITDAGQGCLESDKFITTWKTDVDGESITIPTAASGYSYLVEWGDGTIESGFTGSATHTYTTAGTYTVKISGDFPRIHFDSTGDKEKIQSVEQWGTQQWSSMEDAFRGCEFLVINATDSPDLSQLTNLTYMFSGCKAIGTVDLSSWNTATVTNMSYLFYLSRYNGNISTWNVGNVITFKGMFDGTTLFNQDISQWNIGEFVTGFIDMSEMFEGTIKFNQSLNTWDVSKVDRTFLMFENAFRYNQPMDNWDVSNVRFMNEMFDGARNFDQDLSSWDISSAPQMVDMLSGTALSVANYDATLIGWATLDTGETQIPSNITLGATDLNYCIGETAKNILTSATYNWTITDAGQSCDFTDAFIYTWQTTTDNEIINIPTSSTEDYNYAVDWGDGTIESGLTGETFHTYTTAGVHTIKIIGEFPRLFFLGSDIRENLLTVEQWGTQQWTSMSSAFSGCINLKLNATDVPDLSSVTIMRSMFSDCTNLEDLQDKIGDWDVSTITTLSRTFENCTIFNENIGGWNLVDITSFSGTFKGASAFNQDISNWNASNVDQFDFMFEDATAFNQPIGSWTIGPADYMDGMFKGATSFNQDLSNWDMSNAYKIDQMFNGATAFNQNLGSWDISNAEGSGFVNMFVGSAMSATNYDNTLIGWATLDTEETQIPTNKTLDADATYCLGATARNTLINTYNWTINDGGISCDFTDAFITTWETTADNESITIPTTGSGYGYIVDWGDGTVEGGFTGDASHTYATANTYTVKIIGSFPRIRFNNAGDKDKIQSIEQWGPNQWTSMASAFSGCSNIVLNAVDTPDLSNVTNMNSAFAFTTRFIDNGGEFGNWNVSEVTSMGNIFIFSGMNENINNWNVSKVQDLSGAFFGTLNFNQPLNNWVLTNLNNIQAIFNDAAEFNQPLNNWNVSGVDDLSLAFNGATSFNQDLSAWDVSNVTGFYEVFRGASNFDQNLGAWDISSASTMTDMLRNTDLSIANYDATLVGWATQDTGETIPNNINLGANNLMYCAGATARITLINTYNWTITDSGISCGFTDAFITTWETTVDNESITIPTTGSDYDYMIDWGDGTIESSFTGDASHTYTTANTYTVKIIGSFPRIFFNSNAASKEKIQSVEQWGTIQWMSMNGAFSGCTNLTLNATDIPDLTQVTTMYRMFRETTSFVDHQNMIGSWNVSNITSMGELFEASGFNENINNWDVRNVESMTYLFHDNTVFNQPLDQWVPQNVSDFEHMFNGATAFNQPIGNWNIDSGAFLESMFQNATAFNQDLGNWDISNVDSFGMVNMLIGSGMSTTNYDNTLIGWATLDTGETGIPNIRLDASATYCIGEIARNTLINTYNWTINDSGKNCDFTNAFITTWKTDTIGESITIPTIGSGYNYKVDWGDGVVGSIFTGDTSHTYATAGTYTVKIIGNFPRIYFNDTGDKEKIQSIEQWGTQQWTSMEGAYMGCYNLVLNAVDTPDLSNVTNMNFTFALTLGFIDNGGELGNWNLSEVTSIQAIFAYSSMNENINNWNVSNVEDLSAVFLGASEFNQPLNSWVLTNANSISGIFNDAAKFNQPLNNWNISGVSSLAHVFNGAEEFNQPLDNWDVSNVSDFQLTFVDATAFNQSLANWDISNATTMTIMLRDAGLSQANYDATLIGWATLDTGETQIPSDISLGATGLTYCLGETARNSLTSTYNWDISDDGLACSNLELAAKVYLQGAAINPNTGEETLMRDDLRVAGLLPTTSPYADGLTCDATVFNTTGSEAIVDWVWVELRDKTDNEGVLYSTSALLQRDGDIVDVDGISSVKFNEDPDTYFVAIKHRNHLGMITANAVTLSPTRTTVDFTNAANQITFGSNAQTTSGMQSGIVAMWSGNVNEDIVVQYSGTTPDTPNILSLVLNDPGNFLNFPTYAVSGYSTNDINMNGNTQYSGTSPDTPLILQNVLAHPGNFLNFSTYQIMEQLPEN